MPYGRLNRNVLSTTLLRTGVASDGRTVLESEGAAEAARVLEISYRQAHRIWVRYRGEGDSGLVHRGRGRTPNNAIDEELKQKIIRRYQERYQGFGLTLAAEKLSDE